MVEATGSKLANISFEDLAKALDSDPDFRDAILHHLGVGAAQQSGGAAFAQAGGRNQVRLEAKAHFALDDHKVFDLNGDGLKITMVAVN